MGKKLKIIVYTFLLLAGSMPLLFVASFKIWQEITKHKMRTLLEERLLQEVTIKDDEIQWIEKGEEIRVDGEMFDIKKIVHHHGTSTYTGLFDRDETLLIRQLDQAQDQNSPANNKLLTDFFQWLQSVFGGSHSSSDSFYAELVHEDRLIALHLPDQFMSIVVPPPKRFVS